MGKLIAFLGGISSGKSGLAEARFLAESKKIKAIPVYLATLDSSRLGRDADLRARLLEHRGRRPKNWKTVEIGRDLGGHSRHKVMLLDGLGMWVALRLGDRAELVVGEAKSFVEKASKGLLVAVLDEVGQGGISPNSAARRFADLNGRVNQVFCAGASEVWRVDAGIASRLR